MSVYFSPASLQGAYRIQTDIFTDSRGAFREVFREEWFSHGKPGVQFLQENCSVSKKGVLRGLHFQKKHPQAKLITVLSGKILDVIVDIRMSSPTFGKHELTILDAKNATLLFVPPGLAHGFLALEEHTIVSYRTDNYYDKDDEGGILWDDPTLGIDWLGAQKEYGIETLILSEKDRALPDFGHFKNNFVFVG